MKKPLLESLFNNVADLKVWDFIKKRLWHRHFPVNFPQFFNTPNLQNTSGWLLLLIPLFQPTNQTFVHWWYFVLFSLHFFYFIIDKLHGSLLRKHLKMKILFFTIVFYFLHKCGHDNFAPTIICQCSLKKIQISFGKNLGNCRQPRQILKATLVLK